MRFTKDHEWVELDGDVATVGITAYAAEQLGDVVFVETPDVGKTVKAGDGSRWSRASRRRPTSTPRLRRGGRGQRARSATRPRPSTPSPEGDGWFAKLKLADPAEVDALMDRARLRSLPADALTFNRSSPRKRGPSLSGAIRLPCFRSLVRGKPRSPPPRG